MGKTLVSIGVLLLVCAMGALGQTDGLPSNLAGGGGGFQSTGSPQTSLWAEGCHRNPDVTIFGVTLPSYGCVATDYTAKAKSARVEVDTVLLHRGRFAAGTKTGAGVARGENGVGGSFAGGGWMSARVRRDVGKESGVHLVVSGTWSKDDVAAAQDAPTPRGVLRALGTRGAFRFGFVKSW